MKNKLDKIGTAINNLTDFYAIRKYLSKEGVYVSKKLLLRRIRNIKSNYGR